MANWSNISLYQFQKIDVINSKDIPEIDKTLFTTCIVFDYTEFELDNLADTKRGMRKLNRLTNKLTKIVSSDFKPVPFKRVGWYVLDYDISKLSFGQYIELAYFLSINPVQNCHYVLSSVSHLPYFKNNSTTHRIRADYFLKQPVTKVIGSMALIMEKFNAFNKEYSSLFGLDREVSGDVQEDQFNKRYGWIYAASQIAEYERISLDETFKIPIRQAFNDLAYLKAKAKYEMEQINKK